MDNTVILNEYDLSSMIDEYAVTCEQIASKVITTMDYVEHFSLPRYKVVIQFTLLPMSDSDTMEVFNILKDGVFDAIYTAPYAGGANRQQVVRLLTNLSSVFNIKSISGIRYYNGRLIELRAVAPGFGDIPVSESVPILEEL